MIELLTGKRETIIYEKNIPLRMHLNKDPEDFPLHWQNSFEIIMPLENEYVLHVEGKTEKLMPGDIMIITPGTLHSISAPKEGMRYILLVNMSIFSDIKGAEKIPSFFFPYTVFTKDNNTESKEDIQQLMDKIWQEYSLDFSLENPLKYAALYSLVLALFVLAGRNNTHPFFPNAITHNPSSHKYTDKFNAICTYMDEHCSERISFSELASLNGFSESHFNRLFKQFTGVSCYDFLNHSRITYAKKLLAAQSNMTIVDISMQCGFSSLSTFNRIFKSITNTTPSEYRSLCGGVW